MSTLPPLPPGFEIEQSGSTGLPPLPPGFELEAEKPGFTTAYEGMKGRPFTISKEALAEGNPGLDAVKTIGRGVVKGAAGIAGLPGDASEMFGAGMDKLGLVPHAPPTMSDMVAGQDNPKPLMKPSTLTSHDIMSGIQAVTGEFKKPETNSEKVLDSIGQFLPGAMLGPGGVIAKAVRFGVVPGAASEYAGQATEGTKLETPARLAAGVGASLLNPSRLITPHPISAERQAFLDTLNHEGVTATTAGQRTGSSGLRYTESALADVPFSGQSAEHINEQVSGQFTRAALRRIGEDADRATPEVMDRAFHRIGQQFDRTGAANNLTYDQPFVHDLTNAVQDYHSLVPPSARSPMINNTIADLYAMGVQGGGTIPGTTYQAMRSRLSRAARGSEDPQLSHAISDMTEALDDAMERSIARTNPGDLGAFTEARRQYRNILPIERAAAAASGADGRVAHGFITPGNLRGAVVNTQGRRAYVRGQGDYADLARAGEAILKPLPQSGTAPRENILHLFQLGGLLGLAGGEAGGLAGAGAGAMMGAFGAPAAGRALFSRPVQEYLANQLLGHGAAPGRQRDLMLAKILMEGAGRPDRNPALPTP